ncbi:MAG: hypothetical protein KIT72_05800 [Polyangiaceae bacterium]|nr:hypothetical protein [Polyangiaceae bacterium]MCW5789914.1 hypothetical protein [Polyangiaceae bacterium]
MAPRLVERGARGVSLLMGLGSVTLGSLMLSACGGPGEAEDPRSILGDDLHGPPDSEPEPDPLDRDATRTECRAAAQRMAELGIASIAHGTGDLEEKVRALIQDPEIQATINQTTERCLAARVGAREARCYAEIPISPNAEAAMERCAELQ